MKDNVQVIIAKTKLTIIFFIHSILRKIVDELNLNEKKLIC